MASTQDWYARKLGLTQQQPQQRQQPWPPYAPPQQDYSQQFQPQQQPQEIPPNGQVTVENFVEMAGRWRGGMAHRTEKTPCPSCGSSRFFSRGNANSRSGAPSPHCFDCGYNGLFTQGDPQTWGAA